MALIVRKLKKNDNFILGYCVFFTGFVILDYRRVTLGAKGAKMCTQALAPAYIMCTQAPTPTYTMCTQAPAPDWLGPVLNQSGVLKFAAGAWVHNVYAGIGAWVHNTHFGSFCTECYPSVLLIT